MFDPFKDFAQRGYLQNIEALKDPDDVKAQEHLAFEANLEAAVEYLADKVVIDYDDFLTVHRILFADFYPTWAGRDRHELGVAPLVGKGDANKFQFAASQDSRRAVLEGLRIGNIPAEMRSTPGTVMGYFAWGHPFLDGNGRTMLLVHTELCHRAGFMIDWHSTTKPGYLSALTTEIENPGKKALDIYLKPFMVPSAGVQRGTWIRAIQRLTGLDGRTEPASPDVHYRSDDLDAHLRYREFMKRRGV